MDPVQNSPSVFREWRTAARYTQFQTARILGVGLQTIANWESSRSRPRTPELARRIAEAFGKAPADALKIFRNVALDKPCPCGCGGKRALRGDTLGWELACADCKEVRFYKERRNHRQLCPRHKAGLYEPAERWLCECVGYTLYSIDDWACPAPHQKEFTAREAEIYYMSPALAKDRGLPMVSNAKTLHLPRRQTDDPARQPHFVNIAEKKFRCGRCAGAFRLLKHFENELLKKREEIRKTKKNFSRIPRTIRSKRQLIKLHQWYFPSFGTGATKAPSPQRGDDSIVPKPDQDKKRRRKKKLYTPIEALAKRWRCKHLPAIVHSQGLCDICGVLLLCHPCEAQSFIRTHYRREHPGGSLGLHRGRRRRGPRTKREVLTRHLAWFIRHKAGESLRSIAAAFACKHTSVLDGINEIVLRLPRPEQVKKNLQNRVVLLRSAK